MYAPYARRSNYLAMCCCLFAELPVFSFRLLAIKFCHSPRRRKKRRKRVQSSKFKVENCVFEFSERKIISNWYQPPRRYSLFARRQSGKEGKSLRVRVVAGFYWKIEVVVDSYSTNHSRAYRLQSVLQDKSAASMLNTIWTPIKDSFIGPVLSVSIPLGNKEVPVVRLDFCGVF